MTHIPPEQDLPDLNQPDLNEPGLNEPCRGDLDRLLSAWADNSLSDDEFDRLDELLRDSAQARQAYVRYVNLCAHLGELVVPSPETRFTETRFAETQFAATAVAESSGAANHPLFERIAADQTGSERILPQRIIPPPIIPQRLTTGRVQRRWAYSAAVLALSVFGLLYLFDSPGQKIDSGSANADDSARHIAVVTNVDQPVWETGSVQAGVGSALGLQTLKLISGRIDVNFASGARISVRGPAEFSPLSESRGMLVFGELSAFIPDQAAGFVIDTPSVEVVDRGTEFGVSVDRGGIADVHVFRGAVEARTTGVDEIPGSLFQLEESQTRRFSPAISTATDTSFIPSLYPRLYELSADEPHTRGAVCLLRQPPQSVAIDTLESDDFILLFQERTSVTLQRPLPVTLSVPGRYEQFRGKSGKLPTGSRVTSYLLHFDATQVNGRPHRLRLDGSVTFSRPILGVIAAGKQLVHTDWLLGHPETAYDQVRSRGLDSKAQNDTHDFVTLSEDRRTLDLSFSVRKSADQLRVLIAAPEEN